LGYRKFALDMRGALAALLSQNSEQSTLQVLEHSLQYSNSQFLYRPHDIGDYRGQAVTVFVPKLVLAL